MFLADILRGYKKEVICDLAETYHIYDYKQYSPSYIALLIMGLRSNSRFKMALSGQPADDQTMLNALMTDYLALLTWFQTKDGQKNRNRPVSIYDRIMNPSSEDKNKGYDTAEDFEKARKEFLKKGGA